MEEKLKNLRIYKYGFNLNASHSYMNGPVHSHTFKIIVCIRNLTNEEMLFTEYENKIEELLSLYRGKNLNEVEPFFNVTPTIENMAIVFYSRILKMLEGSNLELMKLELGDNYTTSVNVSNYVIVGNNSRVISEDKIKTLKELTMYKYGIKEKKHIELLDFKNRPIEIKHINNFEKLIFENFVKEGYSL